MCLQTGPRFFIVVSFYSLYFFAISSTSVYAKITTLAFFIFACIYFIRSSFMGVLGWKIMYTRVYDLCRRLALRVTDRRIDCHLKGDMNSTGGVWGGVVVIVIKKDKR